MLPVKTNKHNVSGVVGLVQSQSVSPQKSAGHQKKEVATSNATVVYLKGARDFKRTAYPRLLSPDIVLSRDEKECWVAHVGSRRLFF
jgi:hypothetical protein